MYVRMGIPLYEARASQVMFYFQGVNECLSNKSDMCSQKCVDLKSGYKCECDTGYKLLDDKVTCTGM